MSFSDLVDKEQKKALGEVAPPTKKHERMVKHIKANKPEGRSAEKQKEIAYATAWKDYNKESVGEGMSDLSLGNADLDPWDMAMEDLKALVQQARGTEAYDDLHKIWLERMYSETGGHGPTVGPDAPESEAPMTLEDLDFTEGELSTAAGDAGPDKKWDPRFEEQPDDAGEAEWIEPKPDYDTAEHKFSPKGVIELGVDDEMANKAYDKGGKVTKPTFDTSPYKESIRVQHPLKGMGTVKSIAEGVATVEWDRLDLRIQGPEKLTKEEAQVVTVVEKYTDDPDAATMGPKRKKKKHKKDDKNKVDEDQYEQQPSFQVAPPPSMTIFQDQEPDDGKWKADPLSTQAGAEAAGKGDEVEGELEEPDDAPDPLNINDLGDPDSGRGESIAKQVFSGYDGEGGDQTEIDYHSDKVDYDRQEDSSHNKQDQDSGDDGEDREQDEGQDNEGREDETMKKKESRITGADLGFDLYESDITLADMDVEGILTEDARPHDQGMGGGSAGVRDDEHGDDAEDNPSSPLHMKEHQLGEGEVAMTKELLAKLLSAIQGVDESKMEAICAGLVAAGNKEDRTLDVQDISMIMGEIKAAHSGGGEESADDSAELDQAMGGEEPADDYGDMGDDDMDMEEEETCEGCGEYEDTAAGDLEDPEGGAEIHRREGKKQIMGSEGHDDEMTETEGSGTPISDQKTKGKGPGGGSADEKGQKPSDDIIPPNKKGTQRGSLGPVTDSNPLPPGDGKGGKPMTEAWLAPIPGMHSLDGGPEIDEDDPDAELKMIRRRAGIEDWWKV